MCLPEVQTGTFHPLDQVLLDRGGAGVWLRCVYLDVPEMSWEESLATLFIISCPLGNLPVSLSLPQLQKC